MPEHPMETTLADHRMTKADDDKFSKQEAQRRFEAALIPANDLRRARGRERNTPSRASLADGRQRRHAQGG